MTPCALLATLGVCVLCILGQPRGGVAQPAPLVGAGTDPEEHSLNLVTVAEGDVRLRRKTWLTAHPMSLGTILQRGDLLQLAKGGKAEVLCDNLTVWKVPVGLSNLTAGCPKPPEAVLTRGRELIIATRDPASLTGPYVISPRLTKVFPKPLQLRWQGVPGTTTYLVRLIRTSGTEAVVWEQEVSATEVLYHGPDLEPHRVYNYKVAVQALDGPAARVTSEGLGFTPLSASELMRVEDARRKLAALAFPSEVKALALALLYIGHDLRAAAMQTLDPMARSGSRTVAVHATLGHLARQMGLWHEAEAYYTQASRLAERTNDLESRATIQEGLGLVYAALQDAPKARHWFKQAQQSSKQLGDQPRLDRLARHLARLPTP